MILKRIINILIILELIILISIFGMFFIKKDKPIPKASVVMRSVPAYEQPTPVLNIRFAFVDQKFEECCQELNVVDSVIQPTTNEVINIDYENQVYVEEFVQQYQQYEEPILMAIANEEIEYYEGEQYEYNYFGTTVEEETYQEAENEIEGVSYQGLEEEELTQGAADVEPSNDTVGDQIVNYARQWIGVTPYVNWYDRMEDGYITNSLENGTDCSGFVSLIYDSFGIVTSAASNDYQYMSNIDYEDLQAGDVVVYGNGGHVAIYSGEDTVIHCSNQDVGTIQSDIWYRDPTGYVHIQ